MDFTGGKGHFNYNEDTRLNADVVIVDEVSMCDEYVFYALVRAIKKGARLILVGDKDQLPSVGAGNILSDIISCDVIPVNYLTQIYRQSDDSLIIENAHKVNRGLMPTIDNRSKDFFFDAQADTQIMLKNCIDLTTKRLPAFAKISPKDIQVLCPMKKGILGVENSKRGNAKSDLIRRRLKREKFAREATFSEWAIRLFIPSTIIKWNGCRRTA